MQPSGWFRRVWFVGGFDFRQLLAVALVDLCFPPARNVIALAILIDDLLDRFLGNREFFGNLCANAVKLRHRQFLVASLNLGDLFGRWHKGRGRWNLLALRFRRRWRLRRFRFRRLAVSFLTGPCLPCPPRSRAPIHPPLHPLPP